MLLERDRERVALASALDRARAGHGSLVLVGGPLGVGKSALLDTAASLAESQGMSVLRVGAIRLDRDFGCAVVRRLLRHTLATVSAETRAMWLAGEAQLVAAALSDDPLVLCAISRLTADPAMLHSLRVLMTRISATSPVAVIVDDVQRSDALSLAFLEDLTSWLDELPVTVVVAAQEGDPDTDRALVREITFAADTVLRPAPLSVAAVTTLLEEAHVAQAATVAPGYHHACSGNPLMLVSLLRSGATLPSAQVPAEEARPSCPSPLRERLSAVLTAQSGPVREYARAMVLLDAPHDMDLIGQVAGLDSADTVQARRALARLGLLVEEGRPYFLRDCLRAVVEDGMTLVESDRFHRRAAQALHAAGYPAEQVAAQCLASSGAQGRWAKEVMRSAAVAAIRRGAPDQAVRYLRRALIDCAPNGDERAWLLVELAAAERSVDPRASMRHVARAVALLPSARDRAAALAWLSPTAFSGAPLEMSHLLDRTAADLGPAPELTGPDHELALRLEARSRFRDMDNPRGLAVAAERLDRMGQMPALTTAAERELVGVLAYAATLSVRLPARRIAAVATRLLEDEPYRPMHQHTVLPLVFACAGAAEATVGLEDWLELALQVACQNDTSDQPLLLSERAFVSLQHGRMQRAKRDVLRACDLIARSSCELDPMTIVSVLAAALSTQDAEVMRRAAASWPVRWDGDSRPFVRTMYRVLRTALLAQEDPEVAAQEWQECAGELDRIGWCNPSLFPVGSWSAAALHQLGRSEEAVRAIREECDRAALWGAPAALGRALRVWGLLDEQRSGLDLLAESAEVLRTSNSELELARTLVAFGSRLHAADFAAAEERLREGHTLALRVGSLSLADRARRLLTERGQQVVPGVSALTAAESRVARLSADGTSNQQIAEMLGVTRRSVEKHLTSCYRKLGISGKQHLKSVLRMDGSEPIGIVGAPVDVEE
ncbi:MAG: AAA family ATPase [Actinocatenispora sp.]